MKAGLTMSVTKISEFLHAFEARGIGRKDALKAADINPSVLDSPDNRLTAAEVDRIMRAAVRLTNNDDIGLRQGELLSKGFSSILGYILMNCGTLGEAIEKYRQYEKIVDETGITRLKLENGFAVLHTLTLDKKLAGNRQFSDFKIAGTLSYIKLLTGEKISLREVHFMHRRPADASVYDGIFECPILFGKSVNALIFDRRSLELPIIEPNRGLLSLFEKSAREMLKTTEGSETLADKVLEIILRELNGNVPSVRLIAGKMGMSARSLQMRLRNEGTSYKRLVNGARKDMAAAYLKENKASIGEIAYVLGFSETSAFHRAFKKWTGLTPQGIRKRG